MVSRACSRLCQQYDQVVVGGGIGGLCSALELGKRGQKTVVLEQNTLTSGSTWHAAGLMASLKGNAVIASMGVYGQNLARRFELDSGVSIGFHPVGSLTVVRSPENRHSTLTKWLACTELFGHEHELIESWDRMLELHPYLSNKNHTFEMGVFSPGDGYVNPADLALAIARLCRQTGNVEIRENCGVVGVERTIDSDWQRVTAVKTSTGDRIAVNNQILFACAGYARELCRRFLDEHVPIGVAPHQYAIFEKPHEEMRAGISSKPINQCPVVREADSYYYMKPEVGSFMVGVFEAQPIPHLPDYVRQRMNFENKDTHAVSPSTAEASEVLESSIDKAGRFLAECIENTPILEHTGIARWLHGPDTHSIDQGLTMGPLYNTENAFILGGFNSQGIQTGPAAGLATCEWMLDGYPTTFGNSAVLRSSFEAHKFGRVNPVMARLPDWTHYRALESYGSTYGVHYPREPMLTCRDDGLRSPLHQEFVSKNAVFGESYGWMRPLYFLGEDEDGARKHSVQSYSPSLREWYDLSPRKCPEDSELTIPTSLLSFNWKECAWFAYERAECIHARTECAVVDMSPFVKFTIKGAAALRVTNCAVVSDLDLKFKEKNVVYTACVNKNGYLLVDLTVVKVAEDECICILPSSGAADFKRHMYTAVRDLCEEPFTLTDVTTKIGTLALLGPKSRVVMEELFPTCGFDNEAFPFSTMRQLHAGLMAVRISYAGELGWELYFDLEKTGTLINDVYAKFFRSSVCVRDIGVFALLHCLRIEKGFVHNGHDISPSVTPYECGLGFCVGEGDNFVGKVALSKHKAGGLQRRLVSFTFAPYPDGCWSPTGHESEVVYRNGVKVGYLTSAGYSHTLDRTIGLGFVQTQEKKLRHWLETGAYEIRMVHEGAIRNVKATVSMRCVVDPAGRRMQGEY